MTWHLESKLIPSRLLRLKLVQANPSSDAHEPAVPVPRPDRFLSPLSLDERTGELGAVPNHKGFRCSDKGFLPLFVHR